MTQGTITKTENRKKETKGLFKDLNGRCSPESTNFTVEREKDELR